MIFQSLAHAVTVTPNGRDLILQRLDKKEVSHTGTVTVLCGYFDYVTDNAGCQHPHLIAVIFLCICI